MPALIRHPQSPTLAVSGLSAEVSVATHGDLLLTYQLIADCTHLRLPPPLPPARLDGLWKHTCFELFVAPASTSVRAEPVEAHVESPSTGSGRTAQGQMPSADGAYREFNFSPAGHWQAYAFTSYRQGGELLTAVAPRIEVLEESDALTLRVNLPSANLPAGPRLLLGLTAVLEASDGRLAYWALRHTAEQPDFHRADTFALDLDVPPNVDPNLSGTPA